MKTQFVKGSTSQRCSIFVDFSRINGADAINDLDMPPALRTFSEQHIFDRVYEDSVTTLFYQFGSIRIWDNTVKGMKTVIQDGLATVSHPIETEDDFLFVPPDCSIDIRKYMTATPNGIITSMYKPNDDGDEAIAIHFNRQNMKPLLQYSYRPGIQVSLIKRIQKLDRFNRIYLVTNAKLREHLGFAR